MIIVHEVCSSCKRLFLSLISLSTFAKINGKSCERIIYKKKIGFSQKVRFINIELDMIK